MSGLVSVFSSIILLATVSTLAIALLAYLAYKVREWRKPDAARAQGKAKSEAFQPVFIRRHMLDDIDLAAAGDGSAARRDESTTQGGTEK